ncbi:MAG: Two-component transcriptional response regulator, LuxR family, partial [uncultured Rubrobacteraceae bacterium]
DEDTDSGGRGAPGPPRRRGAWPGGPRRRDGVRRQDGPRPRPERGLRPARARLDVAGPRRGPGRQAAKGGRGRRPGPDAHGPRATGGPRRGPRRRRRRLPPEALRLPRTARQGAGPGQEAPREDGPGDGPRRRRRRARPRAPRGSAWWGAHRPDGQGVRAARDPDAASRAGLHPLGVDGHRVGRHDRRVHERGGPLRPLPAQETRPRRRALACADRARRRLHLRPQAGSV